MIGTEQLAHISLPTEISGSVKWLVGITNPFRTDAANCTDLTIQPIIVHSNRATGLGHSDWEYCPIGSLDSGTNVPRSRRNIYNRTWMNPQGPIVTTIQESNSMSNFDIFYSTRGTLDLAYRGLAYHFVAKSESETLEATKFSKMLSAKVIL